MFVYSYGYYPFKKTKKKNNLFIGFYESSKFFDDIKDVLRKEFEPKYNKLEKNKKLYKKIEQSESVCVSIRRGDFLAEKYKSKHYVCTPEYFEKSISLMLKKIKNAQFIVFSDDINWVKNNMKFPANTLYESGDDPVWEKLRLMYSCKHFIISNSTFSWWAQYLSKNEKKIVIAPSQWLNGQKNPDFYDKKWSLVDISSLKKRD